MPGSWILSGSDLADQFSFVPTLSRSRAKRHSPASGKISAAKFFSAVPQNKTSAARMKIFFAIHSVQGVRGKLA